MRRLPLMMASAGMLLASLSSANAVEILRTWVSSIGSDSNTCVRLSPCATFAGALTNTLDGGSINCVDSGSYANPAVGLTITKGVEIDCRGVYALVEITGTTGVVIQVADPVNQSVTIRGLVISGRTGAGAKANARGIWIKAARTTSLSSTLVEQFQQQGIIDTRSLAAAGNLYMNNVASAGNNGPGFVAAMTTNGFNSNIWMDEFISTFNTFGVAIAASNRARINNSKFTYNTYGIETDPGGTIHMEGSVIAYSSTAAVLNSGSISIANSDLTFNTTVFSGNSTLSYGNSRIANFSTFGTNPTYQAVSNDRGQQ